MTANVRRLLTKKGSAYLLLSAFVVSIVALLFVSEANAVPEEEGPGVIILHEVAGENAATAPSVAYHIQTSAIGQAADVDYLHFFSVREGIDGANITRADHFEVLQGSYVFNAQEGYIHLQPSSELIVHLSHGEALVTSTAEHTVPGGETTDRAIAVTTVQAPSSPWVSATAEFFEFIQPGEKWSLEIARADSGSWDSDIVPGLSDIFPVAADGSMSWEGQRGRYSAGFYPVWFTWHLDQVEDAALGLTKTLQAPDGTTLPQASFDFEFTPVQVQLTDTPVLINSRPVTEVPSITNQTLALNMSTLETNSATNTVTVTGSIDLMTLVEGLNFPGGGVYAWNVRELSGSSGVTGMSYDDSRFQIRVTVDRYGDPVAIDVLELVYAEGQWQAGAKLNDMNFVNTLVTSAGFEISKTIPPTEDNAIANLETDFNFTLSLTQHALAPLDFPLTAQVVHSDTGDALVPPRTVTITGPTTEFTLRHGQTLRLPTLPAGTIFNVTEAAHDSFTPGVDVIIGAELAHSAEGTRNTALATGNHSLSDAGRNAAEFENNTSTVPMTGLIIDNAAWIAIALAIIALVASTIAKSRRRAHNAGSA